MSHKQQRRDFELVSVISQERQMTLELTSIRQLLKEELEPIKSGLNEVKQAIQLTSHKIDEMGVLTERVASLETSNEMLCAKVHDYETTIHELQETVISLEGSSRSLSVKFLFVKHKAQETPGNVENCESLIIDLCKVHGVDLQERDIERAHRLGHSGPCDRPILVKFNCFKDRQRVLQLKWKLKQIGIILMEDFSWEVLRRHKWFSPVLRAPHPGGETYKAKLNADKLVLHSNQFTMNGVHKIPDDSYPELLSTMEEVESEENDSKTKFKKGNLSEFIDLQKREAYPFKLEYESIPKQTSLWKEAARPELKHKNRYRNILPYDYNRVILVTLGGDKLTDYINASYIKDYKGETSYIAALGVTKTTMVDFWRMIWEQNVSVIVMVTNLYEEGKIKCDQYWPREKHAKAKVGIFTVVLSSEETLPCYVLRKLTVTKEGKTKKLSQYHYVDWPDKRAPPNVRSLLKLREVVKKERSQRNTPVLVHCSAGVGRTGTLIALDILLEQLEKEQAVDIRQCVVKLRKQRTNLVQTLTQYVFLYDALDELITIGDTVLSCQNLQSLVKKDGAILYEKHFQFLEKCKPKLSAIDLEFGKVDNQQKNRDLNVVPALDKRAKIPSQPETYVNAVIVKGYSSDWGYCVTQIPLRNTITDCWTLTTELKSSLVICFQNNQADTEWLPEADTPLQCGDLTLKLNGCTKHKDWTEYDLKVQSQSEVLEQEYANVASQIQHRVRVLTVTESWTPLQSSDNYVSLFHNLYNKMTSLRRASSCRLVTIMCLNGAVESGLFVAGSNLMDMAAREKEVNVFQTVKQLRETRPQFVNSLDQYKLLHRLPVRSKASESAESEYYNL